MYQECHFYILLLVIVISGILGGAINYYLNRSNPSLETTGDEKNSLNQGGIFEYCLVKTGNIQNIIALE